MTDSDTAAVV